MERISLVGGSEISPAINGVTVVVGPNNVGKTTLLDELQQLLSPASYYSVTNLKLVEPSMSLQRSGTKDDLLAWLQKNARWGRGSSNPQEPPQYYRRGRSLNLQTMESWSPGPTAPDAFWVKHFPAGGYGAGFESSRSEVGVAPTEPTQVLYEQPLLMQRLSSICDEVFGFALTLDDESPNFRLLVGSPEVNRPAQGEDKRAYRDALSRLPWLSSQGHGVTSWMSIVTELLTGSYQIIVADEPEVFLHPPQARALGRYLARLTREQNSQVIVASHDRNLLAGLIEESQELSVVRLSRTSERTFAHQLSAEKVRELWADPVLRYSDVLDGLFHMVVVIAEAHRDCTFYRAAAEHHGPLSANHRRREETPKNGALRISDIMFLPSNGKQAIPRLVAALAAVSVPIVVTPDLDILSPGDGLLRRIVEATNGDWTTLEPSAKAATHALAQPTALTRVAIVRVAADKAFDELLEKDAGAVWDKASKREVFGVLQTATSVSDRLKREGVRFASGSGRRSLEALLAHLSQLGIVPVRVGELERFAQDLDQDKARWLEGALAAEAFKRPEAQEHIELVLASAEHQVSRATP